jgi:hypothetical protein
MGFAGNAGGFLQGFNSTFFPLLNQKLQQQREDKKATAQAEKEEKERQDKMRYDLQMAYLKGDIDMQPGGQQIASPNANLSLLPNFAPLNKSVDVPVPTGGIQVPGMNMYAVPVKGNTLTPEQIPSFSQQFNQPGTDLNFEPGKRPGTYNLPKIGIKTAVEEKTNKPFDPTSATGLNTTTTLRKEYNDIVKDFRTVREKYKGMETTYQNAMKLGDSKSRQFADQAMIIGLNKLLDPSSVVRESEYARTPEGLSAFNRMSGYLEKLQKGGAGLTNADRADLMETAKMLYQSAEATYMEQRDNYSNIAKQYGVPAELVLGEDLSLNKKKAKDVQQELLNGQDDDSRFWR